MATSLARCFRVHTLCGIMGCYIETLIVLAEFNMMEGGTLHLTMASPRLYGAGSSGTININCFQSFVGQMELTRPFGVMLHNSTTFVMHDAEVPLGEMEGEAYMTVLNVSANTTVLYACEGKEGESITLAYSIIHTGSVESNGFYFNSGTKMLNAGESLRLTVETNISYGWVRLRDNSYTAVVQDSFSRSLLLNSTSVRHGDLFGFQSYDEYSRVSLIRIIVRGCAADQWGPPACEGVCNQCSNGGVCDDKTGQCICAPGFSGQNCTYACGKHRFGWECEFECGQSGPVQNCNGTQFSMPDPYGSSCISGYSGRDCDTACSPGTYGAGCTQICGCTGSEPCDVYTGLCIREYEPNTLLIAVVTAAAVFLVVLIVALINECRHRLTQTVVIRQDDGEVYENTTVGLPHWATHLSISKGNMDVGTEILGRDHFGDVRYGLVKKNDQDYPASITTLLKGASPAENSKFMAEFRYMIRIGHHQNIVNVLGACEDVDTLYVALEYQPNGDLRSYLRKARSMEDSSQLPKLLQRFAFGVAKGMQHFAVLREVHQDLAARNILLDGNLVPKISAFGLSGLEEPMNHLRRVSVRWKPPESLSKGLYTTKSNVWSFGVLMWEIATLGATPYADIETRNLPEMLESGYRLPQPSSCDQNMYELMQWCWHYTPGERPPFMEVANRLSEFADQPHYIRLSQWRQETHALEEICTDLDDS